MFGIRPLASVALAQLMITAGCTCGTRSSGSGVFTSTSAPLAAATDRVDGRRSAPLTLTSFSAPIAAARAAGVDVVAGLDPTEGAIRVVGVADGKPIWAVDALHGVSWAREAELSLRAGADGGVALVWRGPRAGKLGRALLFVGPRGELRGEPTEVDADFCATLDGLAWLASTGPARVMARAWAAGPARQVLTVSADRDPSLACGDHAVVVLGVGDDDVTAASFTLGAAVQGPTVVMRDADFRDDDERDHYAYTIGDNLGIVRVADSGAVAMRELPLGGGPTPWRRVKQVIAPDDDVVAVDGDENATLVVFTHGSDESCPGIGSTAEGVRALRVDRKTGEEAMLELAPADCDRSPGPFWIAGAPPGPTVAWVERATTLPANAAPISGVSLRTISALGMSSRRIDLQADAVSDGGCDSHGCTLVALRRAPDGDGMQPGTIEVVGYP